MFPQLLTALGIGRNNGFKGEADGILNVLGATNAAAALAAPFIPGAPAALGPALGGTEKAVGLAQQLGQKPPPTGSPYQAPPTEPYEGHTARRPAPPVPNYVGQLGRGY